MESESVAVEREAHCGGFILLVAEHGLVMTEGVEIALIGLAGAFFANSTAVVLGYLKLREIGRNVNGINAHLRVKTEEQSVELDAAHSRADRAEGHKEGSDSERNRETNDRA
jgi:hypothetical protein